MSGSGLAWEACLKMTEIETELLTHFSPVSHFYTPENVRKPMVF